jgi:glycosyltransferase involved in cell wall biosynthesis
MATYNGGRFIREQLDSILDQLTAEDEVVVVDDGSSDDTLSKIRDHGDERIRLFCNDGKLGVNGNFAKAIGLARGDLIFLSDQDDVWTPGRLELMCKPFASPDVQVVAGNHALIDADGTLLPGSLAPPLQRQFDSRPMANLLGIFRGTRNYFGCAMGFRAGLRDVIFPYPRGMECHDIWIAMIGIVGSSLVHLPDEILLHRVHGSNASIIRRSLGAKLLGRAYLFIQLIEARRRLAVRRVTERPTGA